MEISAVIPVYRGRACLKELVKRLESTLSSLAPNFEILLIDDGCPENSWEEIKDLAKSHSSVKGIKLSRNFGQHQAIRAGMAKAFGEKIVILDCDLQDPPEAIEPMYKKMGESTDIVMAVRKNRKDGFLKIIFSTLFYKILSFMTGIDYDGSVGNFRIFHKKVAQAILSMSEQTQFLGASMHWVGFKTEKVEVEHGERYEGQSSYGLIKLIQLGTNIIIAHSYIPLRISIILGLISSTVGFAYGANLIFKYFSVGIPIQGWASLMVSLWFLFGILFVILGIIGIYIGKIFDETKERPHYIIGEEV